MEPQQFAQIASQRLDRCGHVMVAKAKEYSRGNDRLHNFKRAAIMQGITPVEALRGMWAKHLVSLMDMIDDVAGGAVPSPEMVDEKISDTINYAVLLEGLVQECRELWTIKFNAGEVVGWVESNETQQDDVGFSASTQPTVSVMTREDLLAGIDGSLSEQCPGRLCARQSPQPAR